MKIIALMLLVTAGTAAAEVTFIYEAKDKKLVPQITKEAEAHKAALDKATEGKPYTLHVVLQELTQTADTTKCKFNIMVGAPGNSMAATITGGGAAKAIGADGIGDCIGGVLGGLLDDKVVKALGKK